MPASNPELINPSQGLEGSAQQLAKLPEHLAIMKMDRDNISALAVARPRNMETIKTELEATLTAFPVLAEQAIYRKPVGKVLDIKCSCGDRFEQAVTKNASEFVCPRCGNKNHDPKNISRPRQKFAEGLSIRAAEALAEAYGYNLTSADVDLIDEDTVKVRATFVDYQRGRIWQDGTVVSKFYRGRGGAMTRIADDRFYSTTVNAEKSKRIREVINRSVNAGLKAWFQAKCDEMQGQLMTDDAMDKMVTAFGTLSAKITLEVLERFIGQPRSTGWTVTHRKHLLAIYNGIKDNETTVDEVFFDEDEDRKPAGGTAAAPGGPVGAGDLVGAAGDAGTGTVQGGASSTTAQPQTGSATGSATGQPNGSSSSAAPAKKSDKTPKGDDPPKGSLV